MHALMEREKEQMKTVADYLASTLKIGLHTYSTNCVGWDHNIIVHISIGIPC